MSKIIAGALSAGILAMGTTGTALADGVGGLFGALFDKPATFAPVTNERYRTECGSCHLAFPPELLPADAWRRVVASLKHHFGDDASQDPAVTNELLGYLTASAAQGSITAGPHALAVQAGVGERTPRITDTAYFHGRHAEISLRYVKGNPKIGSFANCQACHLDAADGTFSEAKVTIPGKGN